MPSLPQHNPDLDVEIQVDHVGGLDTNLYPAVRIAYSIFENGA